MWNVDEYFALALAHLNEAIEARDYEKAHALEDQMRRSALVFIRAGVPGAIEIAEKALSTDELSFPRWCG